jgi:hypothetical protein
MSRTAAVLLVAALLATCGRAAEPVPAARRASSGPPTATVGDLRFHATGTPPVEGHRCRASHRSEGGYRTLIGPTEGRPGTSVEVAGATPLFAESGRYRGPRGRIGLWFNLPFAAWTRVYSSSEPPTAKNGVPVIHLGEATVAGLCSYRITFRVPSVPPGRYLIVPIEHGLGSSAAFAPLAFRVSG